MLHHLSFAVRELKTSARFYDAVLGALGYVRVWTADDAVGYGLPAGEDQFAIKTATDPVIPADEGSHLAFTAPTRETVAAFHFAALAHGGRDNGPPGLRPKYGPNYYATFVIDPDGYRLEAVICS